MHASPSKIQTHCARPPSLKTPLGAEVTSRKKSNKVLPLGILKRLVI